MNKVYACSDLHGMKNLYNQISDFLDDTDIVYFLGDAGDRGPAPWELIKLIREDKRFIYLKGNHEDMLANAMRVFSKGVSEFNKDYPEFHFGTAREYNLLRMNGGESTFNGWVADHYNSEWTEYFDNLPVTKLYTNKDGVDILLSHAGCTPWYDEEKDTLFLPPERELIWDREHIMDDWQMDNSLVVVHGHTPLLHMNHYCWHCPPQKDGIIIYCDGHKINIDNGAFATGKTVLLDLDTFETKMFYDEDYFFN